MPTSKIEAVSMSIPSQFRVRTMPHALPCRSRRLSLIHAILAIALSIVMMITPNPATAATDTGREIFIFLPAKLLDAMREQLVLRLPELIQKSGKLTLHLIELPSHRVIASLTVPARLSSDAKRRPEFQNGWKQIGKFIQQSKSDAGTDTTAVAIDLPTAFGKIAAIRLTEAAPEVLLIGNPLYDNPREPWFSMAPQYVFSDSSWLLPFGPFGQPVVPITPGSQFQIVSTKESWGFNSTHEYKTERFYRVGIQHKLQGQLQPITSDLATALQTLRSRTYETIPKVEIQYVSPNAKGQDERLWRQTVTNVAFEAE